MRILPKGAASNREQHGGGVLRGAETAAIGKQRIIGENRAIP
jgi:hypothetical protein